MLETLITCKDGCQTYRGGTIAENCRRFGEYYFATHVDAETVTMSAVRDGVTYGPITARKRVVVTLDGLRGPSDTARAVGAVEAVAELRK